MSDIESNNSYYVDSDSDSDSSNFTTDNQSEVFKLKNIWSVYDHVKSDNDTYELSMRKIGDIDSIVSFWQFFNNYPKPSLLFYNGLNKPLLDMKEISSLSFFKKGIYPKWEDPINKKGAEISRRFGKKDPLIELENNWFELLYACIGENIDESITGIRIVDSSQTNGPNNLLKFKIELWFSDISKRDIIETQFKNILNLDNNITIYYKTHEPNE
jgi:hypothetical protein